MTITAQDRPGSGAIPARKSMGALFRQVVEEIAFQDA